jgi:hypothetical protein
MNSEVLIVTLSLGIFLLPIGNGTIIQPGIPQRSLHGLMAYHMLHRQAMRRCPRIEQQRSTGDYRATRRQTGMEAILLAT